MQQFQIFDTFTLLGAIILIGLFFIIVISLIDSILTDRGLRDLYKIVQKDTGLLRADALIIAMAYQSLGMRKTLKILNGVYEE